MGRRSERHLLPFAAVAVVGTLVLGGCQSDAAPPATSAPSPSATRPSPTPSESSPTASATATSDIPTAAGEKTEKGAEAFVRFFYQQVNMAWTSPQSGLVAPLSERDCQFCLKTEADARRLVERGEHYQSDPINLSSLRTITDGVRTGQALVQTDATQHAVDVVDASKAVVRSDVEKELRLITGLVWREGRWFVYEVEGR